MGKLYFYEWKKLFRQHSFLLFTLVLLLGNCFALYQYEKYNDYYINFYLHRQDWEKFIKGDNTVPNAAYYQSLSEDAQNYVSSYGSYLKQIPEQAEILEKTKDYQEHNKYLYRNLEKTVNDYKNLSADGMKADPSIGVKELASYNYGIYFQFMFLFVLSYFVISAERKKGLFLLSKGTKKGHMPLASAKFLTMVSAGIFYGILQECSNFLILGYFYGYGDITRKVQSISIFRDCSISLTVAQAMLLLFLARIFIGMLLAVLICSLAISLRKEGVALLLYTAIMGVEMFLNSSIQISSCWNAAKCVNVFFAWNMKNLFGVYVNLNVFGYPIGKSVAAWTMGSIWICILVAAGLYRFSASCQISSGNLLEEFREKTAKRTSFVWHNTSVYFFELQKVFFQQKRGCLLPVLLIWCILCAKETGKPIYYDNPAEGEYHRILSEISGPVTKESLNYIADQRAELDAMYEELGKLGNQMGKQAELKRELLHHEIMIRDEGISLVEEQRELLMEKPGDISGKFWIDEKSYITTFYDYRYDLMVFFTGAMILVLWMSGIEAEDDRKKLYPLLHTTMAGKKRIWIKKKQVCITGTVWCILCTLLPQFLRYERIDNFKNTGQALEDFTMLHFNTSLSVEMFLLLLLLAKILLFMLVCGLLLLLVRRVRSMEVVIGAGVGFIGLVILLMWYFHMDLTVFFLRICSVTANR